MLKNETFSIDFQTLCNQLYVMSKSLLKMTTTYFSGLNEQVDSQRLFWGLVLTPCELFPRNYGPPWGPHLSLVLKSLEIFVIGVHFFDCIVNVDVQCAMRTKKCKNFSPRNDIGGLREPFENLRKKSLQDDLSMTKN